MTLPKGWEEKDLGHFFEFQSKSGKKAGEGSESGKYKFFTSSDIQKKFIDSYDYNGEYLIFGTGGGASIHYCNDKFSTSTDCFIVKVKEGLRTKYVYYFLRANIHLLEAGFKGAGLKHVSKDHIKEMKIRFPSSIKTQERIIALLEKAEQIKNWRKEADALSKDYLKSVFVDMFGDPVINAKKWHVVRAIDVCKCIVPGRDKPKIFNGNIPWITTDDLVPLGYTNFSKKGLGLSNEAIKEVRAKIIPKNSVVMTCVGELGIISIISKPCVINQQLHSFQCSDKIEPLFLMYTLAFQTPYMYKTATSTTVPYMNKTSCNNTPIILPSLPLQKRFSEAYKKFNDIKLNQQNSIKNSEDLFNSMMQKAFKGELA